MPIGSQWFTAAARVALPFVVLCSSPSTARAQADAPLTWADAASATYRNIGDQAQVTLAAGRWEGAPVAPGAASRPVVTLVRDVIAAGDLDNDRASDALVLLSLASGGSGDVSYLAMLSRRAGATTHVATAILGDRVQLRSLVIASGRAIVETLQPGANDARCCPGDLVTRTFTFEAGRLVEHPAQVTGRLSIDILTSGAWKLVALAFDEAAPRIPEVTLRVEGTRAAGSSGCNRYTTTLKAGASPGDVTFGAAAGTRMMCPPERMAVEARFLKQLAAVKRFGFLGGRLALTYDTGDGAGVMLFDHVTVSEP